MIMEVHIGGNKLVITTVLKTFRFDLLRNVDNILKHSINSIIKQRLDIRSLHNHVALQNLSIFYTWKNVRQQCKNSKLKIIAPTLNDEFELPDVFYSVSYKSTCSYLHQQN